MVSGKASFFRLQKSRLQNSFSCFWDVFGLHFGAPGQPKITELIFSLCVFVRNVPRVVFGLLLAPFWCHFGVNFGIIFRFFVIFLSCVFRWNSSGVFWFSAGSLCFYSPKTWKRREKARRDEEGREETNKKRDIFLEKHSLLGFQK